MTSETKLTRLQHANRVIDVVAAHGRKFFAHQDRVARLELDARCRVWFIDAYSQKRIYTHCNGRWRGFTNGGTLRNLVNALRVYITTGEPIPGRVFGPWSEHVCNGDLWGYGADMAKVRADLASCPAVSFERGHANGAKSEAAQ